MSGAEYNFGKNGEEDENDDYIKKDKSDSVSKNESSDEEEYINFHKTKVNSDDNLNTHEEMNELPVKQTNKFIAFAQSYAPKLIENQEKSFLDSIIPKIEHQPKDSNENSGSMNFLEYINENNKNDDAKIKDDVEYFGFNNFGRGQKTKRRSRSRSSEPSERIGGGQGGGQVL